MMRGWCGFWGVSLMCFRAGVLLSVAAGLVVDRGLIQYKLWWDGCWVIGWVLGCLGLVVAGWICYFCFVFYVSCGLVSGLWFLVVRVVVIRVGLVWIFVAWGFNLFGVLCWAVGLVLTFWIGGFAWVCCELLGGIGIVAFWMGLGVWFVDALILSGGVYFRFECFRVGARCSVVLCLWVDVVLWVSMLRVDVHGFSVLRWGLILDFCSCLILMRW